jgi:glucose-1-phosphate cytidylyltransferase
MMKVVILAGGLGTRISEETEIKPKPMVEIGGKPILWHIMKHYSHYGWNDFIICLGYKGYKIKEYFNNYFLHQSDVTFDLSNNNQVVHSSSVEPWKVTLVDTGEKTMTGGRIKRIQPYVGEETFMMTYGDGVSDINLDQLLAFHRAHGKLATLTAIQPASRFGVLDLDIHARVLSFQEKPKGEQSYINGGFFVLEPRVFSYIQNDATIFEREPLEGLAEERELLAFKHEGFWRPMDTLRDKIALEDLWSQNLAPWKSWEI